MLWCTVHVYSLTVPLAGRGSRHGRVSFCTCAEKICFRLLPCVVSNLWVATSPSNLRIGSGAFGLMASRGASDSAAPSAQQGAASLDVKTEAAPPTSQPAAAEPPKPEEVPVPETPQAESRQERNNRRRRERKEEERTTRTSRPAADGAPAPKREARRLPQPVRPLQGMPGKGKGPMDVPMQHHMKGSGSRPASDPGTGSVTSQWNMIHPMMGQSGFAGKGGVAAPMPGNHPMTSNVSMGWYWTDGYQWYHTTPAGVPAQAAGTGTTTSAAAGASQPSAPGRAQGSRTDGPAPKGAAKAKPAPGRTSGRVAIQVTMETMEMMAMMALRAIPMRARKRRKKNEGKKTLQRSLLPR